MKIVSMKIWKEIFSAFSIRLLNSIYKGMTTKIILHTSLFIALLFFLSCTEHKEETRSNALAPRVITSNGYVVPKDSMAEPEIIFLDESKLIKIPAGNPKVVLTNTNVRLAGKPKIVLVGTPRICVPGQGAFLLPRTVPAIDSPFAAGIPEMVLAKDASSRDENPANFSSFSKLQGLKHNSVTCMFQDKSGNLWFGTAGGGVSKYDGKSFTHFTDRQGLSNNDVFSILEDKSGNLWFGTFRGGVSKYDGKSFTNFTGKQGLSGNDVISILEDKNGNLWFGTNEGVSRLSIDGKSFLHFTDQQGLSNNYVSSILEDKSGNLWFGTLGGVSKYDGKSFTHFNEQQGLSSNNVSCMLEDKSGNLWFGTLGGVSKYDGKSFTHFTDQQGLSNNSVTSILEDKSGNLWFGTLGGVSKLALSDVEGAIQYTFTNFTEKQGLSNNSVESMLEDKSGNLWVGTYRGGVSKYDGKSFTHFTEQQGLSNNYVFSTLKDKSGNLWFGTRGAGVSKYDGTSFTHFTKKEGLSNNVVSCMLEDKSGNLWFGTLGGVSKYNGKSFTHFTGQQGLSSNDVMCILEDKNRNLWFGTRQGVSKYDGKSFTNFTDKQGLSSNDVRSILEDKNGNLWFGTYSGGLTKYTPSVSEKAADGVFTHFATKQGLSNNDVFSIVEDKSGNLWFGTQGGGVSKLTSSEVEGAIQYTITNFTDQQGLSNNDVRSILEDNSGNLWFGTRFGLSILKREKLALFSEKAKFNKVKEQDIIFKNYSYEDGFWGIGVTGGKTMCEDKNGTIWIGANDRLTAYHPEGASQDTLAPNIQITNIALFNENIDWTSLSLSALEATSAKGNGSQNNFIVKDTTITLGNGVQVGNFEFDGLSRWYNLPQNLSLACNNNYLTFNFIGITMAQPQKVKYQYKLEGIDENWSALSKRTEAPYGNIPNGTYTFKVKAMNSEGVWSKPFEYIFTIRPPWWKTWWAYCLYAIFIGTSIGWIVQYRSKALRRENLILEEKVKHRTNQLQSSLDSLKSTQTQLIQSEKMASLGELTAGIAHEIQNPLNFVNNFAEVSRELVDEILVESQKSKEERDEILEKELLLDISQNLEKINHHGKRADAIVKGMLQHSRSSSGTKELTDINALCDEYLRLSYHGLRAKDKSFNATIKTDFDAHLPKINIVPQDIGRVILNLLTNAFHACTERSRSDSGYEPTVSISTKQLEDKLEIKVSDNGIGVPDAVKEKIFQPFFTTKPTGQGTGLGSSLSYDIIKAHGGEIKVETIEGNGFVFILNLPTT